MKSDVGSSTSATSTLHLKIDNYLSQFPLLFSWLVHQSTQDGLANFIPFLSMTLVCFKSGIILKKENRAAVSRLNGKWIRLQWTALKIFIKTSPQCWQGKETRACCTLHVIEELSHDRCNIMTDKFFSSWIRILDFEIKNIAIQKL